LRSVGESSVTEWKFGRKNGRAIEVPNELIWQTKVRVSLNKRIHRKVAEERGKRQSPIPLKAIEDDRLSVRTKE